MDGSRNLDRPLIDRSLAFFFFPLNKSNQIVNQGRQSIFTKKMNERRSSHRAVSRAQCYRSIHRLNRTGGERWSCIDALYRPSHRPFFFSLSRSKEKKERINATIQKAY